MRSLDVRRLHDESNRAAYGSRKLDRALVFGPVFCFVDKEQSGLTAGSRLYEGGPVVKFVVIPLTFVWVGRRPVKRLGKFTWVNVVGPWRLTRRRSRW
jgi:hypothetical protein